MTNQNNQDQQWYQSSIDCNGEITSNTEMNSFTKLATGSPAHSLNKGSSSHWTKALRHRKVCKNKVVRTCNRHSFHWQRLYPTATSQGWVPAKSDLKHLHPTIFLLLQSSARGKKKFPSDLQSKQWLKIMHVPFYQRNREEKNYKGILQMHNWKINITYVSNGKSTTIIKL